MKLALRHRAEELRELGLRGALFRIGWECLNRSGTRHFLEALRNGHPADVASEALLPELVGGLRSLFPDPTSVSEKLTDLVGAQQRELLRAQALDSLNGKILCFGRTRADFGSPIDWQLCPGTGMRWDPTVHWSRVLNAMSHIGDVKLSWEVARFPHAYLFARAAVLFPELKPKLAKGLAEQIRHFVQNNPSGFGIHWSSGQEIAFRLMAWCFGARALFLAPVDPVLSEFGKALIEGARAIESSLSYARHAVHNNHLLSESLALLLVAALLPSYAAARRWRELGDTVFEEGLARQFYQDGGYIQQSHNYHRLALQVLMWSSRVSALGGEPPRVGVKDALTRSVDFLWAQQNECDGRLPNFGANDGALPSILSTCDFSDFRPTLQAASLLCRGERLYPAGPWDEEAAWMVGPHALDAPIRAAARNSVSFSATGFHVLRSAALSSFGMFRCGSVQDRFSQIDMLHLDVWWRGQNVLVDGGSYLYNADQAWYEHFFRTASHNTVTVDGRDQMLHWRRFKSLYWTEAKLLEFFFCDGYALCAGEHYGFRRHPGRCVHRRSVLMAGGDLWIVVDHVKGKGTHEVRLHWLGGQYPHQWDQQQCLLSLATPDGDFSAQVLDLRGRPFQGDLAQGQDNPPRGWLSRYYAEKVPVPSLAVSTTEALPVTRVSVLGAGKPVVNVEAAGWRVCTEQVETSFSLEDGMLQGVRTQALS